MHLRIEVHFFLFALGNEMTLVTCKSCEAWNASQRFPPCWTSSTRVCIYCRKAFGEHCNIQIAIDYEIKLEINFIYSFYTPVFRRDVLWYGDVCPSVRVSVCPFSTLFSNMLWHIDMKFCIWLSFTVLQIKFECRQFASIFLGVMPLLKLRILVIHSFPHFSHTCFDILRWNFAHDFFRSSSSDVNLRQFSLELCPFWYLEYWKIHSFPHFSLTWFDILSWNFAYDFVLLYYRSSSSVINLRQFLWELCPFWYL